MSVKLVVAKVTETGLTVKVLCIVSHKSFYNVTVASCHQWKQLRNCVRTAQFGSLLGQSRALTICNTTACTHDVASSKFVYVHCIPDDARILSWYYGFYCHAFKRFAKLSTFSFRSSLQTGISTEIENPQTFGETGEYVLS